MSGFETAFSDLYAVQTAELGEEVVATIAGYCHDAPALLSDNTANDTFGAGSIIQQGGYTLQMRPSDFSSKPIKGTSVTCNGSAEGEELQVLSVNVANRIYVIEVGDIETE